MKAVKYLILCLWVAGLLGALVITTRHTRAISARYLQLLELPPLALLDTRIIDVVTLGHRGVWDDFAGIWLLQILLHPELPQEDPQAVFKTIRGVTQHHPRLETLYMLSCFTLAFDLKRPDLCEPITLDGLKAFPDSWRIPVTQGFMAAFRLKDNKRAALYYGLAASRPKSPAFLTRYVQNLTRDQGLSITELQQTLDQLLGAHDNGSRLRELLNQKAPPQATEPVEANSQDAQQPAVHSSTEDHP